MQIFTRSWRMDFSLITPSGEYSRSFLQNAFSRLERYADHGDADESFFDVDGTVDPAHRGPDDPQGI